MMTMSKALGAAGAVKYFKDEYEHARGSYYTGDDKTVGRWSGELAETFGLSGTVNRGDFEQLCEGQDPRTGAQLVRLVKRHARTNGDGEEIETGGHRAGCDITFSAPKSVSLAALVGGDERIKQAHAEAVTAALREVERYAQARLGGNAKAETTGKLLFASFEHDAARPDQRDGYAAPDLHTHNFAFNLTQTAEGKIKPVQPLELYRSQRYGTAIYRAVLAERLQKMGYEIEVDARTGAPEIKGISREYIEAASPRQRDIKETAEALKVNSTRGAASRNRRTKTYDRDEMKARHQELDRQQGGQALAVAGEAREQAQMMSFLLWDEATSRARAQESVTFAIEKGSEREAVNDTRGLMTDALRRNLGRTTFEAVAAEMQAREARGQLVGVVLDDDTKQRMTTEKMLRWESENIEKMRAGQGTQQPIAERVPPTVTTWQGVTLNESQRAAVEQIVTSRDQITGLQGKAGTGKTTTLAAVTEAAERAGYDVQGFAPTTRAAQLLADSGMQTRTLQKFVRQKEEPDAAPRLLVLDEGSLASTKQVNEFLYRVRPEDRVLLVGDVRQHEGVEAGSPFAQLARHGMKTAQLEQIVRQKDEPLREVVENLSVGKIKEAIDGLREQGRITEIADPQERLKTIARDFCEQPDREITLVISPANKERVELNRLIHRELQATGQISIKNYKTKVLENRNELTGAERTFAGAYQPDDVIRYTSGSKKHGIGAGEYARVVATDEKANTLTVKLDKSQRQISYDPKRLQGVSVYREAERDFSAGDRLQFRAPYHAQKVTNGELGTLEKIEKGNLTVALDSGRSVEFPIDKNRHIDHGYAVTSHSSQGQTVNRVLVNADTSEPDKLLNQRMAYVAASRARLDARIYTDSDQRLSAAFARQVDKSTALEARREAPETKARRLRSFEPRQTPEPTQVERPTGTERPPAERVPKPQPEATRPPTAPPARITLDEYERQIDAQIAALDAREVRQPDTTRTPTDPASATNQQTLRGNVGQQGARQQLPIPARPPALPYTVTTPVDPNRPAAEMSAALVKMANENHRAITGQDIVAPVQKFMQQILTKAADQPPTPKQLENLEATSKALGMSEPPQMSTSLQSSLWRAHNAPDSSEILEQFTQASTTVYTQQQQARTIELPEPSQDIGMSID
jgi:conjugative relaxase-like TrwC/TraI family protein